jgi:hypothetical protein
MQAEWRDAGQGVTPKLIVGGLLAISGVGMTQVRSTLRPI